MKRTLRFVITSVSIADPALLGFTAGSFATPQTPDLSPLPTAEATSGTGTVIFIPEDPWITFKTIGSIEVNTLIAHEVVGVDAVSSIGTGGHGTVVYVSDPGNPVTPSYQRNIAYADANGKVFLEYKVTIC